MSRGGDGRRGQSSRCPDLDEQSRRISCSTSPSRFAGKSALESSVAGLLNLLDLRYTGSSPAGLHARRRQDADEEGAAVSRHQDTEFATLYRGAVDWAGDVDFPLIVKPPQEDASLGITHAVGRARRQRAPRARSRELQSGVSTARAGRAVRGRPGVLRRRVGQRERARRSRSSRWTSRDSRRTGRRIASWAAKWGDEGDRRAPSSRGPSRFSRRISPRVARDDAESRARSVSCASSSRLRAHRHAGRRTRARST